MLATNEKDVDFKSVMCIFICTFPFGDSVSKLDLFVYAAKSLIR